MSGAKEEPAPVPYVDKNGRHWLDLGHGVKFPLRCGLKIESARDAAFALLRGAFMPVRCMRRKGHEGPCSKGWER